MHLRNRAGEPCPLTHSNQRATSLGFTLHGTRWEIASSSDHAPFWNTCDGAGSGRGARRVPVVSPGRGVCGHPGPIHHDLGLGWAALDTRGALARDQADATPQ